MAKFTHSVEFAQSPEEIFRYLTDDQIVKQWISGLQKIIPLTEGNPHVGAKSRHIYHENGRDIEMIEELTAYEPNRLICFHGQTDGFEMDVEYRLEPIASGTRVHFQSVIQYTSLMMRLLSPIISRMTQQQSVSDLERLQELIASGKLAETSSA